MLKKKTPKRFPESVGSRACSSRITLPHTGAPDAPLSSGEFDPREARRSVAAARRTRDAGNLNPDGVPIISALALERESGAVGIIEVLAAVRVAAASVPSDDFAQMRRGAGEVRVAILAKFGALGGDHVAGTARFPGLTRILSPGHRCDAMVRRAVGVAAAGRLAREIRRSVAAVITASTAAIDVRVDVAGVGRARAAVALKLLLTAAVLAGRAKGGAVGGAGPGQGRTGAGVDHFGVAGGVIARSPASSTPVAAGPPLGRRALPVDAIAGGGTEV